MSCFGLNKPLLPAKKACIRFASALRSKLLYRLRRKKAAEAQLPDNEPSNHQSFPPVYIDELLISWSLIGHVESPSEAKGEKVVVGKSSMCVEMIVGSSPPPCVSVGELGGVDLRAEMFIAWFREEMRLQSSGEYQELLARGA